MYIQALRVEQVDAVKKNAHQPSEPNNRARDAICRSATLRASIFTIQHIASAQFVFLAAMLRRLYRAVESHRRPGPMLRINIIYEKSMNLRYQLQRPSTCLQSGLTI
jgi:hypothetical protein